MDSFIKRILNKICNFTIEKFEIMEAVDLRKSVLDYIKNKADDKFLKLVQAMATTYSEDEIEERDTVARYNKEIDAAIAEVNSGDFHTQEEVEQMINEWKSR